MIEKDAVAGIRISIGEMLEESTIADIGASHPDVVVCITRICGHVRRQENEIVKLNGLLDMAMKREAKLREAIVAASAGIERLAIDSGTSTEIRDGLISMGIEIRKALN